MARRRPRIQAIVGSAIVGVVVACAVFAPWLSARDPLAQDLSARLSPPGLIDARSPYVLGSDALGRDVWSRLLFGARNSLLVASLSTVCATTLGVGSGLVAGFAGRRVDALLSRVADVQQAIPYLILVIAIIAVLGSSLLNLIAVLSLTSWFALFRVVRAETLALREREFVLAARALGARPARILVRHVLPNVLSSVIALVSLLATNIILFETSLGFLGLGVPPPEPSWGGLIADGRDYIAGAWWISVLPGTVLALLALGLQLISE